MRFPSLRFIAVCIVASGLARAATLDSRVEALFRPPLGEMIALSPDGQRVAYTLSAGGRLTIAIINVENPGKKRLVPVEAYRDSTSEEEHWPTQLRFLRWATADRLIYAPAERIVPLPPIPDKTGQSIPNPDGPTILAPIMAVDADGRQRGVLVDGRDFQETPGDARRSLADLLRTTKELEVVRNEPVHWRMPHLDVVGFLARDRDQLVVGTHGAYSMPMQHLVDIRTGSLREFGDDLPMPPGEPHVFDWYLHKVVGERQAGVRPTTRWRNEDLGRVQRELAGKFPRRIIEILDWSDTHARVLFRVTGGTDPGRIFVDQRLEDLAVEILQCAPWLDATKLHATRWFEFDASDGAHLSGYVTWPGKPRVTPPPLLVVFPAGLPGQVQPAFDPEAQVFADLGFAVARLNPRVPAESAVPPGATADRVAVDDARAALDWIAARNPARPFDRRLVVPLGRGLGGNLAMRAAQLEPTVFRSAIAIDAPLEPQAGLTEGLTNTPDHLVLASALFTAPPESRAGLYRKIEEFLNQRLDGSAAKITATKEAP